MSRLKVLELKRQGLNAKEIQEELLKETGKRYSIETIKSYARIRMDLSKDNSYMLHCKEEYECKPKKLSEDECFLEEMYSKAKCRGLLIN